MPGNGRGMGIAGPFKIQQYTTAGKIFRDGGNFVRDAFWIMSVAGDLIVEDQHRTRRELFWDVRQTGVIAGKVAGHPGDIRRQYGIGRDFSGGHSKITG
jgi:hypothetical protein